MNASFSIIDMALNADRVVQGVMLLLLLMSLLCWAIIIEKLFSLTRARRAVHLLYRQSAANAPDAPPLLRQVLESGLRESQEYASGETRAEYRERIERSMREALSKIMDNLNQGTRLLATIGSSAPFIGLFGTVWGIMNSFIGIASAGDTSLAVVAPGIAEALFATAIGLVAAIPAVIAYNKLTVSGNAIAREGLQIISLIGNRLAADRFSSGLRGDGHEPA